jgi:hypothetical protein
VNFDGWLKLSYRCRSLKQELESMVKQAKLRQLSLLQDAVCPQIPKTLHAEVLELLTQLLLSIVPEIEKGESDEQDHV